MPGRGDPRWWTVYGPDGARLHECEATEAAVRATLPGAVVEAETGAIRLPAVVAGGGSFGGAIWREVGADVGDQEEER